MLWVDGAQPWALDGARASISLLSALPFPGKDRGLERLRKLPTATWGQMRAFTLFLQNQ